MTVTKYLNITTKIEGIPRQLVNGRGMNPGTNLGTSQAEDILPLAIFPRGKVPLIHELLLHLERFVVHDCASSAETSCISVGLKNYQISSRGVNAI